LTLYLQQKNGPPREMSRGDIGLDERFDRAKLFHQFAPPEIFFATHNSTVKFGDFIRRFF
jgi:hypothetical protein